MKIIDEFEKWSLIVLVIAITFLVTLQIGNRFIIQASLPWTEEGARYIFAWIVFIGASYAAKQKAHIGVTVVIELFPKNIQKITTFLMYLLCLTFSVMMIVFGMKIVFVQNEMNQLSPAMRLNMYIPYLSIPLGGVLLSLRFIQQLIASCKRDDKQQLDTIV